MCGSARTAPMRRLSGGELEVYPPSFRNRAAAFGGLQGFPVYAAIEFFVRLAHPAGWNTQQAGEICLRHYPGVKLAPGGTYDCMEAVYGVGEAGGGREAFVTYLRSRTRRVVRGHDKPYAIFEPFGARSDGDFNETEEFVLDMIGRVCRRTTRLRLPVRPVLRGLLGRLSRRPEAVRSRAIPQRADAHSR